MKINFLICFSMFLSLYLSAQVDKSVLDNHKKAVVVLNSAIDKQGGSKSLLQSYSYRMEGTKYFFGHYDVPEKTKPVTDTVEVVFVPTSEINYYNSIINYYGERNKIILNYKDSTYHIGYFADATIKGYLKEREQVYVTSTIQMLQLALKNQKTLQWIGENRKNNVIAFTDNIGERYNLHISKKSNLLTQVTQLVYDEQYGDTFNEVNYEYSNIEHIHPTKITKKEHGIVESEYIYENRTTNVLVDTNIVKYLCPMYRIEKVRTNANIAIEKIASGLWVANFNDLDNKSLIVEFKDYLTVIEAPNSTSVCAELIGTLKLKFPVKPIKLLALSHHHPDHAGGFVAFANQNIPIMTTKGNISFFEKLLHTNHSIVKENNPTTEKATFKIVESQTYQNVSDDDNQFIAYESGKTTDHVQEFLYFYFPKQKILFVGDLVIFPEKDLVQQGKRAHSVYQLINDKKLNVENIYTAWPLKNQKKFGTFQDLKESLKEKYPDLGKN